MIQNTDATISGTTFNATAAGTATIKATIEDGTAVGIPYTKDFQIVVSKATQTAPNAPTLSNSTSTTITLYEMDGCEYRMNGGTWQTAVLFSGLTANTSYTFDARKAETASHYASEASATATFTTGIVPVTNIANIPTAATVDILLTLTGTVVPANATFQTIVWSMVNAGETGATISPAGGGGGWTFTATAGGTATVMATIENGTAIGVPYTQEVNITVNTDFVPVTDITDVPTAATVGVPLALTGTVIPSNATNQTIIWSLLNADGTGATISPAGGGGGWIFEATSTGVATILATIENGTAPGVDYTKFFNISVTPVGIDELGIRNYELVVYPNPTRGELKIRNDELGIRNDENVKIFDMTGKIILNSQFSILNSIDVSHLPSGVYFIKIGDKIAKFMKINE